MIARYKSMKAIKSDEYRSWQRLPGSEWIRAVMDLNLDLYAMKGQAADPQDAAERDQEAKSKDLSESPTKGWTTI